MPAVARIGKRLVMAVRRRSLDRYSGWIDAFVSDNDGASWIPTSEIGTTGRDNGNPPALIEAEGRLYCAFANRSEWALHLYSSEDGGKTWYYHRQLRSEGRSDIGYPQLFKRNDGQLVSVYYWADSENDQQHIEATLFEP